MSNYRDDVQETLRISDFSFAKVRSGDVENIKITDSVISKILNRLEETMVIKDDVYGQTILLLEDSAVISDSYTDSYTAKSLINDSVKIKDAALSKFKTSLEETIVIAETLHSTIKAVNHDSLKLTEQFFDKSITKKLTQDTIKFSEFITGRKIAKTIIEDELSIQDAVSDTFRNTITEKLTVSDKVISTKRSRQDIEEQLNLQDSSFIKFADLLQDQLVITDSLKAANRFKDLIKDTLILSDQFIELSKPIDLIEDHLLIKAESAGFKTATSQVSDTLFIDDELIDSYRSYGAWSSTSNEWDMSRYDAFNYDQLVVIDDKLYGVTADGVELLDYGHAEIGAMVVMPKLDISGGSLAHPLGMFFEYSLEGNQKSLTVAVGTTQSGIYKEYQYALPAEQSGQLTNGRVLFGRGLRGRHFDFTINMLGNQGYINDLSIDIAKTKRRI